MAKILTRDDILAAPDVLTETVEVPEWGGSVIVRGLTGKERDAFEQSIVVLSGKTTKVNLANVRAKLVALTVVDDKGERIFSEKDAEALGDKSAAALDRIYDVAQRLSGLSREDIDELAQNFVNGQREPSSSN